MYDAGNGYHHNPDLADIMRRHGDDPMIAGLAKSYQAQKEQKSESKDANGGIMSALMKRARDAGGALIEFAQNKIEALRGVKEDPNKISKTGEIFRQSLGIASAFLIKGSHAAARRAMRMVNKIHKMRKAETSPVLEFKATSMTWRHSECLASAILQIENSQKSGQVRSLYFDTAFKSFRALTGSEAQRASSAVVAVKPAELAALATDRRVREAIQRQVVTPETQADYLLAQLFEEELPEQKNSYIQFCKLFKAMQERPETFCAAGMSKKQIKDALRRRSYSDCSTFESQDMTRLRSNSDITQQMMQIMHPQSEGYAYLRSKLAKAQRLINAAPAA